MENVATLALHLCREQLRKKGYLLVVAFGGAMIYVSILAGVLAVDEKLRVLMDIGLGLIELTVLVATVYGAATSVLQEIESKTIYLVLTRPVARWQYLLGRFVGLVLIACLALLVLGAAHVALLLAEGWRFQAVYPVLLFYSLLKAILIAALGILFALVSTSVVSTLLMTGFLWLLGHFTPEIAFLVRQSRSAAAWILKPTLYIMPNLALLNLRDRWEAPGVFVQPASLLAPVGYVLLYSAIALALALALFERREF